MTQSALAWSSSQPRSMREALHLADDRRCHYCHDPLALADLTIDHIVPRAFGGINHISNYVSSCGRCNREWGAAVRKCQCRKCEQALGAHLSRRRPNEGPPMLETLVGSLTVATEALLSRLAEAEAELEALLVRRFDKNLDPEAAALAGKCKGLRIGLRYLREAVGG